MSDNCRGGPPWPPDRTQRAVNKFEQKRHSCHSLHHVYDYVHDEHFGKHGYLPRYGRKRGF
jgi:hypothetical protein